MGNIFSWVLKHATEIGLIIGGASLISGAVYLYEFYTTRKRRKHAAPNVLPDSINERGLRDEARIYAEGWRKRLDDIEDSVAEDHPQKEGGK